LANGVLIFGADGYIGWPLAIHLGLRFPERKITLVDNYSTRKLVKSVGSFSLVPIRTMEQRIAHYRRLTNLRNLDFVRADARNPLMVDKILQKYHPEDVIHLAQQRSAPFSMIDQEHALYSQLNNLATNMNVMYSMARHTPEAHILKMGSMGEYGTPEIEITEGDLEVVRKGHSAKVMYPRTGQSWYHLSKVFDTYNVKLANKVFNLTATDIMQGVVYGTQVEETGDPALATRFDFDSIWGTLVNKYVVQAVALNKLLIYGRGKQKRGFLSLYDSVNCLTLLMENPPPKGEYRVVNQLDEVYDTIELAEKVRKIGKDLGIIAEFEWIRNPRVEKEEHSYEVERKILPSLGFKRRKSLDDVILEIFEAVLRNKERVVNHKELIYPSVFWNSAKLIAVPEFRMPRDVYNLNKSLTITSRRQFPTQEEALEESGSQEIAEPITQLKRTQ
jgi:UDP-sulfoquinovose synthase